MANTLRNIHDELASHANRNCSGCGIRTNVYDFDPSTVSSKVLRVYCQTCAKAAGYYDNVERFSIDWRELDLYEPQDTWDERANNMAAFQISTLVRLRLAQDWNHEEILEDVDEFASDWHSDVGAADTMAIENLANKLDRWVRSEL